MKQGQVKFKTFYVTDDKRIKDIMEFSMLKIHIIFCRVQSLQAVVQLRT